MGGACSEYGGEVKVGKPVGKRPLGRHRRRWEDNIKIYLQGLSWGAGNGLIGLRIWTDIWLL
jgi:hypothetical protein